MISARPVRLADIGLAVARDPSVRSSPGRGTRWPALEAISFDFGNTLVPVPHEGLRQVVHETARRVSQRCGPFAVETFLAVWSEERERQFAEEVPQFREVDLDQRLIRVLARLRGVEAPSRDLRWDDAAAARLSAPEEIAWAVDMYSRAFVDLIPAPPGVGPLLERLSHRYRLIVLSNWPLALTIDRYVEAAGWAPWLAGVVVSQRVGTIKPHPRIFRVATDVIAAEPSAILHVGDDWAADIVGAKQSGWRAAYVRTPHGASPLPASMPDTRVEADLDLAAVYDIEAALTQVGW